MFSLLVGFILLIIIAIVIYYILGKLNVFGKVGKFVINTKNIFEDEKESK